MQEGGSLVRDEDRRWVEGSTLDWGNLPARVEGVVEERIGRLEPALREILSVASVEGERFTAEVVAQVQQLDQHTLVQQLSRELDKRHRLVKAQALEWLGPGRKRHSKYRFRHHLF